MNSSNEQAKVRMTTRIVSVLLAVLLLPTISALTAKAEEPPAAIQVPAETTSSVQSPGVPSAISDTDDYSIVWVWGAPAGGLTPDALLDTQVITTENATDITQFGYELSRSGVIVAYGAVNSDVYSITTPVNADSTYTLKVWSITRGGTTSTASEGSVTIVTTINVPLPPIEKEIIPEPIDTSSIIKKQATSESTILQTAPLSTNARGTTNSFNQTDPRVLSATSTTENATALGTTAVVKPSTQGWVIFGMAWYVWLLIIAGLFMAGRGIMAYVNAR